MGYAEEKARVEKTRKKWIYIIAAILFVVVTALCVVSAFIPVATWKFRIRTPKIAPRANGELRIHFIDVGQGDCTLLELPDGKTMLIDGGDGSNSAENAMMRHLHALDIDRIDYLVLTHADVDHCGGLTTVLKYTEVGAAFIPPVVPTANASYAKFYNQLTKENCVVRYNSRAISLSSVGDFAYTLEFLYPYSYDELQEDVTDHNLFSAICWLDYQGVSALFTGDAPKEIENVLMRDDDLGVFDGNGVCLDSTEILKVAHHGSENSSSAEFLRYLNVETAVVSCGEGNSYGHPSTAVRNALAALNATLYRTDAQGSVMITVTNNGTYSVQTLG